MEINKILNKDFVVIDLGSSSAEDNSFLNKFSDNITHIELDALSTSDKEYSKYHKAIKIKKAIHVSNGRRIFYERNFLPCSSFLEFKEGVDVTYGIEDINRTKNVFEFECTTLSDILFEHGIKRIDFLKTDLEGLDFDVIKSIENLLQDVNVIQAETRFQPVYVGESHFFEVCTYMYRHGFEFINFGSVGEWKFKTTNQKKFRDGRMVHADFIFFKKLDAEAPGYLANLVKQIIIAKSLQLNSFSEYLLEQNEVRMPEKLFAELRALISNVSAIDGFFNSFFRGLAKIRMLYRSRRVLKKIHTWSKIDNLPHSVSY